jgi:hypothetical protein
MFQPKAAEEEGVQISIQLIPTYFFPLIQIQILHSSK